MIYSNVILGIDLGEYPIGFQWRQSNLSVTMAQIVQLVSPRYHHCHQWIIFFVIGVITIIVTIGSSFTLSPMDHHCSQWHNVAMSPSDHQWITILTNG
jgi:hypothetical protein